MVGRRGEAPLVPPYVLGVATLANSVSGFAKNPRSGERGDDKRSDDKRSDDKRGNERG